jgi:hypothetical protein
LVTRWRNWGGDRVLFEDGEGRVRSIPTAWTSIAGPDPFVTLSAGRSLFRLEDVLALAALVALLEEESVSEMRCKEDSAGYVKMNMPEPSGHARTE